MTANFSILSQPSQTLSHNFKYWNWGKYADPTTSPIFDGSETSMSGNGESVKHVGFNLGAAFVPPGNGGGCVTTGPFKK